MLVTTPQSRLTPCQLPGRGAFLGGLPLTKSCPRVRGKWHGEAMTKGERLKAAQLFYCSPQSAYAASSPINGGAFGVQYKHGVQCRTPSRSDRFNGVTGVARGPKGRNRNLPRPPWQKSLLSRPWQQLSRSFAKVAQHEYERSGDEQPQRGKAC